MRIKIDIPDELFSAAEALALRLGVSRSQLYTTAVAELLAKRSATEITAQLDEVYAAEPSTLDLEFQRAQADPSERRNGR